MTKSLTEKWKNGEISGCYYWKLFDGTIIGYVGEVSECFEEQVCEVLAPVPSYDEYIELMEMNKNQALTIHKLQERLADAEKALRFYDSKDFHYEVDGVVMGAEPAHKYFVKWGIPSEKCQKQGDFPSEKCKEVK